MQTQTTRRAVLIGGTATAALAGTTAAAFAAIPSWMALKIEAHKEAKRAHGLACEEFAIHDEALNRSPRRSTDPEWKAANEASRFACDREDKTFRALLSERPRNMDEVRLRSRYLLEEARDDLADHPDFVTLLVGSTAGLEG